MLVQSGMTRVTLTGSVPLEMKMGPCNGFPVSKGTFLYLVIKLSAELNLTSDHRCGKGVTSLPHTQRTRIQSPVESVFLFGVFPQP